MLLDDLAKELVSITSSLVSGRTINVMNTEGIIIASTEQDRVGSFHQGAWEVIRSGKAVNIRADQLGNYPGAREGWNMPIKIGGTVIGVVGIYGNPDEIQDIAHLLNVYAEKYYQLESMLRPRLSEMTLRSELLMHLISPINTVMTSAYGLMETLKIQLVYPLEVVLISAKEGFSKPEALEKLCALLRENGFLKENRDIWGVVDDRVVMVLSGLEQRNPGMLEKLPDQSNTWRISLGEACGSLLEIHRSYEQVTTLDISCADRFCDIRRIPYKCRYMLSRNAGEESQFLETLYGRLTEGFSPEECASMVETIDAYYDCSRSVTRAAARMFIHKNTLQYRIKRVLQVLDIQDLSPFWQEYLVRLLLNHIRRKSRA